MNAQETLPAQMGRRFVKAHPYNYGVPGRGLGYTLALLQNRDLSKEVHESKGAAVYTYIDAHVDRAIGAMYVVGAWGINMPCYELQGEQLVRLGTFESVYPWRCRMYRLLNKSRVLHFAGVGFPLMRREGHYRLVAAMLQQIQCEYQRQFPGNDFFVLLYPHTPKCQMIAPFLSKVGVNYLTISEGELSARETLFLPGDGHPNATMQALVAERCADALKKQWSAHP